MEGPYFPGPSNTNTGFANFSGLIPLKIEPARVGGKDGEAKWEAQAKGRGKALLTLTSAG